VKAMILAAGEGTRLKPLTLKTPKVLLPISGVPLIERTLNWLKSHGIMEVAINLHYQGEKIKEFLGDGLRLGMKIVYSPEEVLMGTAGGVKGMERFFDDTFIVVYGDVLADFDLSAMIRFHQVKKSVATLILFKMPDHSQAGIVEVDDNGKILNFVEKPRLGYKAQDMGNGGVYILEKAIFDYIPREGISDFGYDIFPRMIELSLPIYGYELSTNEYLIDIGTANNYAKANSGMDLRI